MKEIGYIKTLIGATIMLVQQCISLNVITTLPHNIYLAEDDKIGFDMNKFVNGSQLIRQAFPQPFIEIDDQETLQFFFSIKGVDMSDCSNTFPGRPLQYLSICNNDTIYLHEYDHKMSINNISSTKLQPVSRNGPGPSHRSRSSSNSKTPSSSSKSRSSGTGTTSSSGSKTSSQSKSHSHGTTSTSGSSPTHSSTPSSSTHSPSSSSPTSSSPTSSSSNPSSTHHGRILLDQQEAVLLGESPKEIEDEGRMLQSQSPGYLLRCDHIMLIEKFFFVSCLQHKNGSTLLTDYDAVFYVLSYDPTLKPNKRFKVESTAIYPSFLTPNSSPKLKVKFTQTCKNAENSDIVYCRAILYQGIEGRLLSSFNVFFVDLRLDTYKLKATITRDSKGINTIRGGANKIRIFNKDWFLISRNVMMEKMLFFCSMKFNQNVSQSKCYPGQTHMDMPQQNQNLMAWDSIYLEGTKKVAFIMSLYDQFMLCMYSRLLPQDPVKLKKYIHDNKEKVCEKFELYFTDEQRQTLQSQDMFISSNVKKIIITFSEHNQSTPIISGYIVIDIRTMTSQYHDIKHFNAHSMSVMNESYYTLQNGYLISLERMPKSKLTITAPKKKAQAKIYFNTISTKQAVNFQIDCYLNRVGKTQNFIRINTLDEFTLYSDDYDQFFGYNAKLLLGNNLDINISLPGYTLPNYKSYVNVKKVDGGPTLDDKDVNNLFIVRGREFVFLNQYYELKILTCNLGLTYIQNKKENITCEMKFNKQFNNTNIIQVKQTRIGKIIIAEQQNKTSVSMVMRLIYKTESSSFNYTHDEHNDKVIALKKSFCDVKMYGESIFTICVNEGSNGRGLIKLYRFTYHNSVMKKMGMYTLIPSDYGNPGYKKGQAQFSLGSDMTAYVVNNNPHDLSFMVIDFNTIKQGYEMAVSDKHPVKFQFKPNVPFGDIKICQTLSTMFFYSTFLKKIYGANIDNIDNSYLNVPFNGENRQMKQVVCTDDRESFQIWAVDNRTEKEYILNYYAFDGTQAGKKLHSEYMVKESMDRIASSNVYGSVGGAIFTYIYDKSSMFYNETFFADMRGPVIEMNVNNIVAGSYNFTLTAFNGNFKKNYTMPVKVVEPQQLMHKSIISNFTTVPKVANLNQYINWKGALLQAYVVNKNQKAFASIQPRLRPTNKTYDIDRGAEMLAIRNGVYMMKRLNRLELYSVKSSRKITNEIKLDNFGTFCEHFNLISHPEKIYVIFCCLNDTKTHINIIKVKKGEEMYTKLPPAIIEYGITKMDVSAHKNEILFGIRSKSSDKILLTKFIDRTDLNTSDPSGIEKKIAVNWRQPGDLSLFSTCRFSVINVNGAFMLTLLSRGQRYFRVITLDFVAEGISGITTITGTKNSSYYRIQCFSEDQNLICYLAGLGIHVRKFIIPITYNKAGQVSVVFKKIIPGMSPEDKKITTEWINEHTELFKIPSIGSNVIDRFDHTREYILFAGNFGDMYIRQPTPEGSFKKIKPKDLNRNYLDDPNSQKKLINPEIIRKLPDKVTVLLYKKGQEEVYAMKSGNAQRFSAIEEFKNETYFYIEDNDSIIEYSMHPFTITYDKSKTIDESTPLDVQLVGFELQTASFYVTMNGESSYQLKWEVFLAIFLLFLVMLCYTWCVRSKRKNPGSGIPGDEGTELTKTGNVVEVEPEQPDIEDASDHDINDINEDDNDDDSEDFGAEIPIEPDSDPDSSYDGRETGMTANIVL